MVFLDRLYTSNTLLYSKIGPARQVPTLQKTTKFRNLGKQRERSPCSLKIEISTNYPTNLIPSKIPTQTLFQTQNPKDVHDASRTTKFRDLGKQRKRSPCSLKIEISTNYPTNLIPSKIPTQMLFQTQNPKDVHDASRTTKFRDLGKQRERSPCSLKIEISTNYLTNLIPTNFPTQMLFQTQNPKDVRDASRTTKAQDLGKQRERSLCSRKKPNFNKLSK